MKTNTLPASLIPVTCDDLCKMTRSSYCLFPKTELFVSGGGIFVSYPYTHSTYSTMGKLEFSDLAFCKVKHSIVTSLLPTSSNSHLAPSGSSTLEGQPPANQCHIWTPRSLTIYLFETRKLHRSHFDLDANLWPEALGPGFGAEDAVTIPADNWSAANLSWPQFHFDRSSGTKWDLAGLLGDISLPQHLRKPGLDMSPSRWLMKQPL